ncbi:DNA double-strand break repair protein Mre11 [Halobium salinum]|uniref:DNA double-strand break repair protein Mre11 n=1 Tax=Halobium salinum TaxID=1364940 RepID=A0ABD5PCW4_9EURY|nr:DNA double-strand break repair protein Mre11 [Halobium salinum]
MTRVIHTGDTHVGYQQYHSPARRQDFLDAFAAVVEDAVDDEADAVVHAGDLFHDRRPELQDLLGVLSVLRTLDDAGIPFLAIVGNHEATRGGQWLDLFENLGLATRLGSEPTVVGDTAFYGLDHVPESRRDDLEYQFAETDAAYRALVGHGLFTPFAHANWDTETVLDSANVDFDAVLLGDNHEADTAEVLGTWVTYCGSTERASTSEEAGRGYNLVTFGADTGETVDGSEGESDHDDGSAPAAVDIRRRALDTRPFRFVSAPLAEGEGVDRVREQVRQYDLDDAVVVVEITGEGDPVTPASIEEYATERGALVARVTDRREFDGETGSDVSFADPDAAVRERVDEMGLSTAALDVDETVRASKVVDSKVREEVKGRVADLLDDPDAFARAEKSESTATANAGTSPASASTPAEADRPGGGDGTAEATDSAETADAATAGETGSGSDSDGGSASETESASESGSESTNGRGTGNETDTDGQVSMEDFQ